MAAMETVALSILSIYPSSSSSSFKSLSFPKPLPSIKLSPSISYSIPSPPLNFPLSSLPLRTPARNLCSQLHSALQEVSLEKEKDEATSDEDEDEDEADDTNPKRKLFVYNLPSPASSQEVKNLFAECGNVEDVEMAKTRFGKTKSYAFVTMASEEEALSVIDRFDSQEVAGRIMRVEFAKSFKKPAPSPPPPPPRSIESRVHVANVDFKVRASHLREFFSASFNPISARVVFNKNRKTGFGFVGFATKEEAVAAIAVLDRKELMGRHLRLALSDKNIDESATKTEEQDLSEDQLNVS